MTRKEITEELSRALEKYLNPYNDTRIYIAKEVTFDYSSEHPIRVDYMRVNPKNNKIGGIEQGDVYCYEIKSCKADYKSGHGLNFIGDYNYLVLAAGLYQEIKDIIPYDIGVLEYCHKNLKLVKKPKKRTRDRSMTEILLMMYRSTNRDLIKLKKLKKLK